jgi:MoxR-like ATPase
MAATPGVLTGIIHGKTIELDETTGLPDGQLVRVTIQPYAPPSDEEKLELLRRAAGGWADDDPEGLAQYLESLRPGRKRSQPEPPE